MLSSSATVTERLSESLDLLDLLDVVIEQKRTVIEQKGTGAPWGGIALVASRLRENLEALEAHLGDSPSCTSSHPSGSRVERSALKGRSTERLTGVRGLVDRDDRAAVGERMCLI